MIGILQSYSDVYLYIMGAAMLAAFGIPLIFVPMRWARVFRWEVPQSENLAAFLGRSLGVFIALMAIFAFKAASQPLAKPFFFDLMLWLLAAMTILHAFGALRKTQPMTETFEIILWVVLFILTLCFYPL